MVTCDPPVRCETVEQGAMSEPERLVMTLIHDKTIKPGMTFEEWKLAYRHRVARIAGIKPECFAETLNMIADDECLREQFDAGENPNDAADNEMSCWEE